MIISLPIRIRAQRFEPGPPPKKAEPIDFEDYDASGPSRGGRSHNGTRLLRDAFPLSLTEIAALISSRQPRGALWINPVPPHAPGDAGASPAMAVWRLRARADAPPGGRPAAPVALDALVFDMADWRRHAAGLIGHVGDLSAFESAHRPAASAGPLRDPGMTFDLPRSPEPRIGDCPPASFAILEALATGAAAVFGRESFADERLFVDACAHAIAMLPPPQRSRISLAAGFTRPLPYARVQWIDDRVTPPRAGKLATTVSALPSDTSAATARARVARDTDAVDPDKTIGAPPAGRTETSREPREPDLRRHMLWLATAVDCALRDNSEIPRAAAEGAADFVDRYFDRAVDDPDGVLAQSRIGRALARLRAREQFPAADPASITESIEAIEEVLAAVKVVANGYRWTGGLAALARASIAALRKIVIEKPTDDRDVAACFLRSISRAPYCYHTIATWLAADDPRGRASIAGAVAATGEMSRSLNRIRQEAERRLLTQGGTRAARANAAPR